MAPIPITALEADEVLCETDTLGKTLVAAGVLRAKQGLAETARAVPGGTRRSSGAALLGRGHSPLDQ